MVEIGNKLKKILDAKQKILLLIETELIPSPTSSPFELP